MKKIEKTKEYEKISTDYGYVDYLSKNLIPEGATHFELEIDYSGCYYEHDRPDYIVHFFKLKS